ncbi:hypothetical protein CQW23_16610 [Capsicum baccatum]|uniref:Uncharacterized protein n=1 Tax=Capsicum baccatum TaxID=33114 RepID=A0A2G2WBF4_CAPBA|nr:hypothetical protein CQW23_16610 [Capsicum baccatum]
MYRPLPIIWLEPLGRLCRINNHSCTEYGRIPRYGHLGSPSEGDSHIILDRAGEESTGDEWKRESTRCGSTSGDSWNNWSKKSPSEHLMGGVKHIRQGPREIPLLHSSGRSKVSLEIQQVVSRPGTHALTLSLYTPMGQKVAGEGEGYWARSISSEFPIQI